MKKRVLAVVIPLAAIILAVVGVVVYDANFSLAKEDYGIAAEAAPNLENLQATSAKALQAAITPGADNTKNEDGVSKAALTAQTSIALYANAVKQFNGQHALHDAALNKSYQTFKAAYNDYYVFAANFLNATIIANVATQACQTAFTAKSKDSTFSAYQSAATTCITALKTVQAAEDPDLKMFATAYINFLNTTLPIYEKLYNSQGKSAEEVATVTDQLTAPTDAFTAKSKAANANITTRYKALPNVSQLYQDFVKELNKKANV